MQNNLKKWFGNEEINRISDFELSFEIL